MILDSSDLPPPRRWPLVLALLAALGWLLLSLLAMSPLVPGLVLPAVMGNIAIGLGVALNLAAPLAVVWFVAMHLRERSGDRAARTALMAEQMRYTDIKLDQGAVAMAMLESRIETLAERLAAAAEPVQRQHETLGSALGQLDAASTALSAVAARTEAASAQLGGTTPAATAQAEQLAALLTRSGDDLRGQLAETDAMLAALTARLQEAEAQARTASAETTTSIAAIADASLRAQDAMVTPLADLRGGVESALAAAAAALEHSRASLQQQTDTLNASLAAQSAALGSNAAQQAGLLVASVEQARAGIEAMGNEAATAIDARLAVLLADIKKLGLALDDQAAHTHEIIDEIGRNFGIVDAKLGNSANTGNAALESITVRLEDARDAIHKLSEPISGTEAALAAVENRLADVGSTAGTTLAMLDEALPAALPRLDAIAGELVLLHESASALAAPISSSGETIEAAQGRLEAARAALEGAATVLGGQLEAARAAIAEIETLTGNASLTASTDLIDVFGRVRDVATQTAGTMRETLSGVITEAEAALDRAGSARAEAAFGAPIRAHIESLEAAHQRAAGAAQAAAERVAERLLSLTGTIAGVEARIDEVDTRFDIRERNTLARRSKLMLDSLQAAAIDLTRLLALDIEDSAWDEYLKGDKSIFARRISQRLDGETLRSINRHAAHDAEFRIEAVRYVEEFEALIGHVMTDREGRSLAMTLLSSDTGKLYLALKEAVERAD